MRSLISYFIVFLSFSVNSQAADPVDPLEELNRKFYAFNFDVVDPLFLKPIAKTYDELSPQFVKTIVDNFFSNLDDLPSAANSLLQGKVSQSIEFASRFLINSSLGLAGIFDVATYLKIKGGEPEDFGQTLAVWGVESGPYLMLPLYGPSTLRDAPSNFFDSLLDPFTYNNNYEARVGLKAFDVVSMRAEMLGIDDLMSGDEYLFVRDIYLQTREYEIKDGELDDAFGDFEGFDDFEDFEDF